MARPLRRGRPRAAALRERLIAWLGIGVVAAAACACAPSAERPRDSRDADAIAAAASAQPHAEARGLAAASRDLARDEQRGGHTLARHVGPSDADLAERLRRERNIPAASTWSDRATAERTVAATLGRSRRALEGWTARDGGRANLALDWRGEQPVGRALRRGAPRADVVSCATVVLKWSVPDRDFYVLTSYPEACR